MSATEQLMLHIDKAATYCEENDVDMSAVEDVVFEGIGNMDRSNPWLVAAVAIDVYKNRHARE